MAMNLPIPVAQGHAPGSFLMVRPLSRRAPARGFTLVEMLVALAITLIMMGAVVTLFGVVAESVSNSRAGIEMSDRLRAARNQLQLDLRGVTATMRPPLRPADDEGYFEIIEGRENDYSPFDDNAKLSLLGDVDDVLMFTTRSPGAPFLGKLNGAVIESPVAEVVYFLAQHRQVDASGNVINSPPPVIDATIDPPARLYTLYRRVLLVAPAAVVTIPPLPLHFYDVNDISIRYDATTNTLIPNTLGDLTKRENRFAHYGYAAWLAFSAVDYGVFPFPVDLRGLPRIPQVWPPEIPGEPLNLSPNMPAKWPAGPPRRPPENAFLSPAVDLRAGDDVLLTNVLSFDVQVFDPLAPLFVTDDVALEPSDPGWEAEATTWVDADYLASGVDGFGAYVDLGYGHSLATPLVLKSHFDSQAADRSRLAGSHYVYDTWSLHYEADGVNQDGVLPPPPAPPIFSALLGDVGTDTATNGLDDNADGVVDDLGEYDTLPPYSAPLRGIKVTIRVYEPSSKQVREAVVIQEFLPE